MNQILKLFMKSRSQAFALAVVATTSQLVFAAQDTMSASNSDRLKLVPSLGYSYFNITGSSSDFKSKSGSSAAVLVQMPMATSLEFESGLEYLETGAKLSADAGDGWSYELAKITVQQLAIPLRAKYNFNPESTGTRYFGKAGLTPTYLMSAKSETFLVGSENIKSSMNDIGVLTQAGLGADWGVDAITGRVSFDLTYSYGLTKVFKDSDGRSTGFQLNLGYVFLL